MNYKQNTGFSPRSSNLSRATDQNNKNIQGSIYTQRPLQQGLNREDAVGLHQAYRVQKFPEQVGFDELVERKEVLNELLRQFSDKNSTVVFQPYKKEQYSKRLMLLQQQIQGLMRQSYMYATKNPGQRTLDYTALINEKQNQVNQLQRKISHLQAQLRMKDHRQQQLEKQLEKRFDAIKLKNDEIQKLKGAQRSMNDSSKYPNQAVNNEIRKLMTTLDNLIKKGTTSPDQLERQVQSWILGLPKQSILKQKLREADENWLEDKYKRYVSAVTTEAASILNNIQKLYTSQITNLKSSGAPIDYDPKIMQLISKDKIPSQFFPTQSSLNRTHIINELSSRPLLLSQSPQKSKYFNNVSRVSVQVPVQDARTKALIKKLAFEMRRLYTKYPKLASQISPELSQYLSQQILDVIEVDELDRLVQIVKYKPDIVKVQNVYAFNSDKNRRVEFHLKVLIKALLEEMEKMKQKTGYQPEIDEGVIGMIRQEVMDVVDVDDILRIYRVVPKIVEVEKVVEQVVQKIVPVPHFVTINQSQTKVVPISNVQVVKDTVNVPLQMNRAQPLIQEKLVLGNQYSQRVVPRPMIQQNSYQTVTQVPRVRQVDRVVEAPVEIIKTIEVEGPQKIVPLERPVVHQLIKQKIVPVERVVQKVIEVQRIIEKIVEVIKQVPKIITVDRVVQKLVPQIQYVESQRVENYVVEKPVEVICYVQKIVPIEKIVERVVSYPEIVEKLVPVAVRQQVIKQIQIIKEVPIYQKELIVQDRIVQRMAQPIIEEVPVPVDRIVEVPFIHEKVRVQTQYRKQPVIERETKLVREAVRMEVPVILTEQKILEVEKPVIQLVKQQVPRQLIKQRLIPVQHYRDQLVPTPFIVEKVIEKLVEVPRVVQIQKIVEKIVLVPRIIQKIVQVEKIVEKIVEKNIYHTNIQPVEYLNEVPIEVESVVTIEVPKYLIHTKQVAKVIQIPVPVVSQVHTQSVRVQQIEQPPRVAIQRREVPLQIIQQKIVPMKVQDQVVVELKQQIIVPMQMPVPTTLIEQKIVPVQQVIPLIQPVDKIRQKIVEVQVQSPGQLIVKDRIVEKLFVQNQVKVVQNQIPYYNDRFKEVQVLVEKIVPVERVVQEIRQIPHIVQKIVHQVNEVPKVYQVQKIMQVPVKQTELITIDRIVPKIVTLNRAFAQIVDKLHEFPRLAQEMKQVEKRLDNIVVQKHGTTEVQQAQVLVEKAVIQQKLKEVDKYINVINQSLQVVDRIVQKPTDPIIVYQQKILQVPVIVQKLAERIVVMPQVVQVLKYIHEVTDNDSLGVAVSADVGVQQVEYQRLGKNVNRELGNLRSLLANLKNSPQFRTNVTIIDNFLVQFNKFLAYPRLRQVMTEKVVQNTIQKDRIVRVPTKSGDDQRKSLASAVLIDKLLMELKRVRLANPNVQMSLDPEIVHIFGNQLQPISSKYGNNYNQLLQEYSRAIFNKFNSYGAFTPGHQLMLRQFIQERFELANRLKKLSKDSAKYKELYSGLNEKYNRQHTYNQKVKQRFGDISQSIRSILITIVDMGVRNSIQEKLRDLNQAIFGYAMASDTPVYRVGELDDERIGRYVREKDTQILQLKRIIDNLKRQIQNKKYEQKAQVVYGDCPIHTKTITELQSQITQLKRIISINSNTTTRIEDHSKCQTEINRLNSELMRLRQQLNRSIQQANRYQIELTKSKEQISKMKEELFRLRQIQKLHLQCSGIIATLKRRILQLEREVKSSKKTQPQDYGRNYQEYIDLNNSRQSSAQSIASDSSRGVYRSAGNYNGGYVGGYKGQKTVSMEQLPQGNYNSVDVRGSGFHTDLNSKSPDSSQNIIRVEGKQLVFSKKASSAKSSSESGGSSGLYGTSNNQVTRRVQNKQQQ